MNTHATLSTRGGILGPTATRLPQIAHSGNGALITLADGRQVIDFIMGFGSVILGHADRRVDDAVIRAIRRGISPTLNTDAEIALTQVLVRCAGFGETGKAALFRTGSDATEAAVRIARAATGRRIIVRAGYNGWHDWCAPRKVGIPVEVQDLTIDVPFNDTNALRSAIEIAGEDLACVITVAADPDLANPEYLRVASADTRSRGAILILDEIRTGFRLGLGGAKHKLSVDADLVTYSKAMANGYAISALVGSPDLLSFMGKISASSLYFRSTDGVAAALATIGLLDADSDIFAQLELMGRELQTGLACAIADSGVPAKVIGHPTMPFHEFSSGDASLDHLAAVEFSRLAIERNVLFHPSHHWFIAEAMTSAHIADAVAAAAFAYSKLAKSIYGRSVE